MRLRLVRLHRGRWRDGFSLEWWHDEIRVSFLRVEIQRVALNRKRH